MRIERKIELSSKTAGIQKMKRNSWTGIYLLKGNLVGKRCQAFLCGEVPIERFSYHNFMFLSGSWWGIEDSVLHAHLTLHMSGRVRIE